MADSTTGDNDTLHPGDAIRVVYSDGLTREPRTVTGTLVSFNERFLTVLSGRLTLVIGALFIMRIEKWEGRSQ